MINAVGIINCIKRINDIVQDDKNRKAAIEAEELVRMRRAKSWGAKSINLYAEMLSGVKMTEEEVRGKKFKEVSHGVGASDSAKMGKEKQAEIIIEQESLFIKHLDNAILDACIKEYGTKGDKKFIVTEEGLKPVKVELDIKITKAQGRRWLKVIEDYSMSGECDFRDLNGVMGELSALIGDDDED